MIINVNSYKQFGITDVYNWIEYIADVQRYFIRDWELENQYASVSQIHEIYPNIKTYNIVMNPWARAKYIFDTNITPEYFDMSSFENFIMNWEYVQLPMSWRGTTTPQVHYIFDETYNLDYILRAETLATDFISIQTAINNFTPFCVYEKYPNYREHYTTEMKQKISDLFKDDIELLSYTF